jgi:hypothetical protein
MIEKAEEEPLIVPLGPPVLALAPEPLGADNAPVVKKLPFEAKDIPCAYPALGAPDPTNIGAVI